MGKGGEKICAHVCTRAHTHTHTHRHWGNIIYIESILVSIRNVQLNSFNLTSDNSEILNIWHLGRVVSRREVLLYTRQRLSLKQADLNRLVQDVLKECLYISCCISWPLVSYSINLFSSEDPRKYRRGRWWPLTSKHKRYPSRILLLFVVEPRYWSNNKKITARN